MFEREQTAASEKREIHFPLVTGLCVGAVIFLSVLGAGIARHYHHKWPPSSQPASLEAMAAEDYRGDSWQAEAEMRASEMQVLSVWGHMSGSVMWTENGRVSALRVDVPDMWFGEDLAQDQGESGHHNWVCVLTPAGQSRWDGHLGETGSYYAWQASICDRFAASANRNGGVSPANFADKASRLEEKRTATAIAEDKEAPEPLGVYRIVSPDGNGKLSGDFYAPRVLEAEDFRKAASNVLNTGILLGLALGVAGFLGAVLLCCAADPRYHNERYWEL